MIGHRRLLLLVAVIVWATAIAVYLFGKKWLLFGAGAAAIAVGIHVALIALAFVFGGASLFGFVARWIHGQPMDIDTHDHAPGVIHWAWAYDPLVWVLTLGRQRAFREKTLDLARLMPGESVLDIGCGTGSLAIAARRRVGPAARIDGIDASPEMISRARKKSQKAGADVTFETTSVETLPFSDGCFDVVMSTVMLHHLPEETRRKCINEVRRVLKPGGRFLAIDFGGSAEQRHTRAGRLHNHVHFDLRNVVPELNNAGLGTVESGPAGFSDLQFVRAAAPAI
jgi:ubiquinone/menaquinone biosynthesis C-methylase UbiE